MSQLLQQFQSTFSTDAVRIEYSEFAKEGAFSDAAIEKLIEAGFDCIYLKPLTSSQRDAFEASFAVLGDKKSEEAQRKRLVNMRARLVSMCWCDEAGELAGTAEEIGALHSGVIGPIFVQAQKLNGMDIKAADEAKND